jgi:hypothetical protein
MKRSLSASEKPPPWCQSKHIIWLEFALFATVYIADWKHHIILSKVPYLFLLGWLSLRLRGMRWRDVGLGLYEGWGRTLLVGILAGAGQHEGYRHIPRSGIERWGGGRISLGSRRDNLLETADGPNSRYHSKECRLLYEFSSVHGISLSC